VEKRPSEAKKETREKGRELKEGLKISEIKV
jgi:hypothetical protein